MKFVFFICALICAQFCWGKDCPITPKHYEELGCVPQTRDQNCPLSFDCSTFEKRDKSRCHFNGTIFDDRKELRNDDIEESCAINCVCRKDDDSEYARFSCAHIDCPEFFGDDLPENCVRQYQKGSCCAQSTVCGDDLEKLAKCEFDGKTYYDGQQIDVENSCYTCRCGEGFEDKPVEENRHCKRVNCLIDIHYSAKFYDGCVPVYYKTEDCCPIEFRCPQPNTKVIEDRNKTRTVEDENSPKCLFGELKLSVGDTLSSEREDDCIVCTCKIPPHPTCVKTC